MLTTEGTARLNAFADAVVAIAITLLVLPLVDIPAEAASTSLAEAWQNNSAEFFMFLLSFAVIARLWLTHHNLGERMGRADRFALIATLPWLLTVVFLPFPTELLGELGNTRLVASIYIVTLFANITIAAVLGLRLAHRPSMWREGWTRREMTAWSLGWWSNPLLCGLALIVCLLVPGLGIWSLLVLFLDPLVTRVVERRSGISSRAAAAEEAENEDAVERAEQRRDLER